MGERQELENGIAALEALRATLGDAVVDTAIAGLRSRLAALPHPAPTHQRKQVTVLFADIHGFTALSETLDPEIVAALINALWARLDTIILEHGGRIDKHIGDAVMALWGSDVAREDDAERAATAALSMQAAIQDWRPNLDDTLLPPHIQPRLTMRIGLNSGLVLLGAVGATAEFTAMGDTVNLASRLEHAAPVGGILISQTTYRQINGLFELEPQPPLMVKGKSTPVQSYRLLRRQPRPFHGARRGLDGGGARMIGRADELAQLHALYRTVCETHSLRVLTIDGEAGIGKSRLLDEFEQSLAETAPRPLILRGRADAATQRVPYALWRSVLSAHFGIQDDDAPTQAQAKLFQGILTNLGEASRDKATAIGQLLGLIPPGSAMSGATSEVARHRQRSYYNIAELCQAIIHRWPTLLLLEDLHWADDASLDLLEYLVRECHASPSLIITLCRPDLYERRPTWGQASDVYTRLSLAPLDRQHSQAMIEAILPTLTTTAAGLGERILDTADGNPYFIEELIRMLLDDQMIVAENDQWRVVEGRLDAVRVPPTIHEVLEAHLDALPTTEREALKRASIFGERFWDEAIQALEMDLRHAQQTPDTVEHRLDALSRHALIFQTAPSAFVGTQEFVFKHTLLREVAYDTVLLRHRRGYHAAAAEWLRRRSGERAAEYAGQIAEHYAQAARPAEAAEWYVQAGRQAQAVYATQTAIQHYEHALHLTSAVALDDVTRVDTLLRLGAMFELTGVWDQAITCYQTALNQATEAGLSDLQAQAQLALGGLHAKRSAPHEALNWLRQAQAIFLHQRDHSHLARTLVQIGGVFGRQGDHDRSRTALRRALVLARAAQDRQTEAHALNNLGNVATQEGQYATAQTLFEQSLALRRAIHDLPGEADVLSNLGIAVSRLGDFTRAEILYQQCLSLCRSMGDKLAGAGALNNLGLLALWQADAKRAQALYVESLAMFKAVGSLAGVALALSSLGSVKVIQGDYAAARSYYQDSLSLRQTLDNRRGIAIALCGLGSVACLDGDLAAATAYYRDAMHTIRPVGDKRVIAVALAGLAGVAGLSNQSEQAIQLSGLCETLLISIHARLDPEERLVYDKGLALASAQHSEAQMQTLRAQGAGLTLDQVFVLT